MRSTDTGHGIGSVRAVAYFGDLMAGCSIWGILSELELGLSEINQFWKSSRDLRNILGKRLITPIYTTKVTRLRDLS
jgi:hypothetical protein